MIRRQVVELFDEALEYPLSVSFEAEESSVSDTEANSDVAALISPEDLHSFRHVTSYPTEEQIIDEFNAYVRGPLRESVVRSLGREDQIPLKLCMFAFWPSSAGGAAWALGCEGRSHCQDAASNLQFDSVAWYLITQASFGCSYWVIWVNPILLRQQINSVVFWPLLSLLTLPLVLRTNRLVMDMVTSPRLQFTVCLASTSLVLFLWWGLFSASQTATTLVGASEVSPLWLSGLVQRHGLCRAATSWQVIWNLLQGSGDGAALRIVQKVDVFICHSWSCPAWRKMLVLCHYFHVHWATRWARPLGYPLGTPDRLPGYVTAFLARAELERSGTERPEDLAVAWSHFTFVHLAADLFLWLWVAKQVIVV
eukprot:g30157.t1